MSKSLVDLRADLLDLAREAAILREEIALYQADAGGENVARELLSKSGLAANTAKLYTGCERIMEYIAKVADNAPIGHGDGGWHAALLKRMSQPFFNIRTQVISEGLFDELDRLRGFRHRERSSYGLMLDGSIVADRAMVMANAADVFRSEVEAFLKMSSGLIGDKSR